MSGLAQVFVPGDAVAKQVGVAAFLGKGSDPGSRVEDLQALLSGDLEHAVGYARGVTGRGSRLQDDSGGQEHRGQGHVVFSREVSDFPQRSRVASPGRLVLLGAGGVTQAGLEGGREAREGGAQVGGELNTVLLILNTAEAVSAFSGAASITLGANLSVALGPVGRSIEGNGAFTASGVAAACYAYSVSRGAFAGVALDGTVVFTRDRLNHVFYGHPASAKQLLSGRIAPPRAAEPLYRALRTHTSEYVQ